MIHEICANQELRSEIHDTIALLAARLCSFSALDRENLAIFASACSTHTSRAILSIILEAGYRAEAVCPFSGKDAIENVIASIRAGAPIDKTVRVPFFPRSDEFHLVMRRFVDEFTLSVIDRAVELGGITARYLVESHDNAVVSDVVIKKDDGFVFSGIEKHGHNKFNRSDVLVFIVDGVIESVSEIHRILSFVSDRKASLVIVARGFCDDLKQTITVNNERGTLDVLLCTVPATAEHINSIADISVVCGCTPVTTVVGQQLAFISGESLSTVEKISTHDNELVFHVSQAKAQAQIEKHRNVLVKRRAEVELDVSRLFDLRIRSLTPQRVTILVPKHDSVLIKKIADGIRLFRAINQFGVIQTSDGQLDSTLRSFATNKYTSSQFSALSQLGAVLTIS